jgi:hypothetical protein
VTTTTVPACGDQPSYASAACRLTALEGQVNGTPAGAITSKLLGATARAKQKVAEAETLSSGGQQAKAKLAVRAAIRALAKMQVRLRSRAGKRIPDPARTSMMDAIGRLGRDLRSLL